ncbi:hypothetical protein IPL85_05265 [Candidatus Saccharibacteria bacterium]|nr:MAG: hypothetical protein IPL85_05265 [Candidatus Saccharibacteria bacterium]
MTAPNHALTGALIGLAVPSMWLSVPLAFVSHFVLDAIPHYDVPGESNEARIDSRQFLFIQIVGGFVLCVGLVALLWWSQVPNWLSLSVCAFIATVPDLLSIPRFLAVKRGHKDPVNSNLFWKFHNDIQRQHPRFLPVEFVWFALAALLLTVQL